MDKKEAILITNRKENKEIKNIYRSLKLNFKSFNAGFIASIVVPMSKQETVFFNKLRGLKPDSWNKLVDLLYSKKWNTPHSEIKSIIHETEGNDEEKKDVISGAIINNLVPAILDLHDPQSYLINIIEQGIKKGATIIVDISLLNSAAALHLSSVIVKYLLNKNQRNFVEGSEENLLKTTFVIDEAQSVLSKESNVDAFVELAKEGRKYQLGGVFITQQPGSIIFEILSQGDNFFVFHLLSKGDLNALQSSNAHYSNDVVTQILNEPIKGKCYMWTSHQPFVLPVQILNFDDKSLSNKAKEIQLNSTLLTGITGEIDQKLNSPVFKQIVEKYKKINSDGTIKDKTVSLFRELNNDEKKFIRDEDGLQKNQAGEEFAIKSRYYGSLTVYDSN